MGAIRELPIAVRQATADDRAEALGFISPGTLRGRASIALLRAGQGLLWVAFEHAPAAPDIPAKLVGLLLAVAQIDPEADAPVGYIQELLVHPAYRRRGVAMHLLDAAERHMLAGLAFARVAVDASPENEAALHMYRGRGYALSQVHLTMARTAWHRDAGAVSDGTSDSPTEH